MKKATFKPLVTSPHSSSFLFIFSVLSEPERGSLSVIATVFDKLNHEYKKYLEAEQSYTMVNDVSYSGL